MKIEIDMDKLSDCFASWNITCTPPCVRCDSRTACRLRSIENTMDKVISMACICREENGTVGFKDGLSGRDVVERCIKIKGLK